MFTITRWSLVVLLMVFLSACSAGPNSNNHADTAIPVAGDTTAAVGTEQAKQNDDIQRLAALWEKRTQQRGANDYSIGPGDVLEINVAGVEEIKNISERVTGDETISLPFVGVIHTRGLTDKTLRSEIVRRLETNYVRKPQVSLFVKEFRSRQVAVIGAVQKPGLYNLASSADTLLSMISQAGGTTPTAAERILFIPAEPAEPDKAKEIVSAMPVQMLSQDPSPLILKNSDPLVISLHGVNKRGQERYLEHAGAPGRYRSDSRSGRSVGARLG